MTTAARATRTLALPRAKRNGVPPFDWYAERLDLARWESEKPGERSGFFACPCHGGSDSLHLTEGPRGKALVNCFACDADAHAVRAELEDAPPLPRTRVSRAKMTPPPADATRDPRGWLAAKASVDPDFLDSLPLSFEEDGLIVYRFDGLDVVKTRPAGGTSHESRWRPAKEHAPPIWPLVDTMPEAAVVTEGETDAIALRAIGYEAFAVTKGAGAPLSVPELSALKARGLRKLFVGFDADEAGREGEAKTIGAALAAGLDVASIVPPSYDPITGRGKDWCEWRADGNDVLPDSTRNDPFVGREGFAALVKDRPDPVIRGWLNRGGVLLLVGGPKDGKTSLAAGMASAAERGAEFAGVRAKRGVGSVWLSEEGYDTWQEKVDRFGLRRYGIMFRHVAFERGLTFEDAVVRAATRAAADGSVLVIDTIAAWAGLDSEADAGPVNAALSVIRFAVVPRRVPAIVIHQTNRSGEYRGSTEFLAQADAMAVVSRQGAESYGDDARAVTITSRYEGAAAPVVLVRRGGDYVAAGVPTISYGPRNDRMKQRQRRIAELLDGGLKDTKAGWAKALGVNPKTVLDDLRAAGAVELGRGGTGAGSDAKLWGLPTSGNSNGKPTGKRSTRTSRSRSPNGNDAIDTRRFPLARSNVSHARAGKAGGRSS